MIPRLRSLRCSKCQKVFISQLSDCFSPISVMHPICPSCKDRAYKDPYEDEDHATQPKILYILKNLIKK